MENKKQVIIRNISLVLALILICGGIFYSTYKYFINKSYSKYEKNITAQIDNIYKINNRVATYVEDETILTEKILSELQNDIDELKGIQNNISSTTPIEKHKQSHQNLKDGLSNNINLYKELHYIIGNPSNSNINNSLLDMNNYQDDCMNYYSLVNINGTKPLIPDEIFKLVSGTKLYVRNTAIHSTAVDSINSNHKEFQNYINNISATFDPIKREFTNYVLNARNGIQTYSSIITIAENNLKQITELEESLQKTSIPVDGIAVYESLLASLQSYKTYLINFKFAVSTEELKVNNNPEVSTNELDALYDDAINQYSNADVTYNGFVSKLVEYKNSVN